MIGIGAGLLGLTLFPLMVTSFDLSAQVAFPIGEATSGGSFTLGASVLGFFGILLFS